MRAHFTSYRESLAIRDRLTKADLGNADRQRDLSLSYERVGDVQKAQGDLTSALTSHRESLAIRDRLTKADPDNADRQRDLSLSYERVGDVQKAQGNLADAFTSHRESLAIRDRLAKAAPDNADRQHDLAVSVPKNRDGLAAARRQCEGTRLSQARPRYRCASHLAVIEWHEPDERPRLVRRTNRGPRALINPTNKTNWFVGTEDRHVGMEI